MPRKNARPAERKRRAKAKASVIARVAAAKQARIEFYAAGNDRLQRAALAIMGAKLLRQKSQELDSPDTLDTPNSGLS